MKMIQQGSEGGLLIDTIFQLQGPRVMSRPEAQRLLPVLLKMTERAQKEVQGLVQRLELLRQVDENEANRVENEIDHIMERWREQVTRLGGQPKGVWIVDFDNGSGLYCWKYPEREIAFEHGYQDGFLGRQRLQPLGTEKPLTIDL